MLGYVISLLLRAGPFFVTLRLNCPSVGRILVPQQELSSCPLLWKQLLNHRTTRDFLGSALLRTYMIQCLKWFDGQKLEKLLSRDV